MPAKAVELLRQYLDAVRSRDVDTILGLFDVEAVVNAPMMPDGAPKSMVGRQAFEPAYRGSLDDSPSFLGFTRPSTPPTTPIWPSPAVHPRHCW